MPVTQDVFIGSVRRRQRIKSNYLQFICQNRGTRSKSTVKTEQTNKLNQHETFGKFLQLERGDHCLDREGMHTLKNALLKKQKRIFQIFRGGKNITENAINCISYHEEKVERLL